MDQQPPTVISAIARVRAWRRTQGWALYKFAMEAGVAEATLRGMDGPNWNPTVRTLEKLEATIPTDWRVPAEAAA